MSLLCLVWTTSVKLHFLFSGGHADIQAVYNARSLRNIRNSFIASCSLFPQNSNLKISFEGVPLFQQEDNMTKGIAVGNRNLGIRKKRPSMSVLLLTSHVNLLSFLTSLSPIFLDLQVRITNSTHLIGLL